MKNYKKQMRLDKDRSADGAERQFYLIASLKQVIQQASLPGCVSKAQPGKQQLCFQLNWGLLSSNYSIFK